MSLVAVVQRANDNCSPERRASTPAGPGRAQAANAEAWFLPPILG
jgi:hypothetical protein